MANNVCASRYKSLGCEQPCDTKRGGKATNEFARVAGITPLVHAPSRVPAQPWPMATRGMAISREGRSRLRRSSSGWAMAAR